MDDHLLSLLESQGGVCGCPELWEVHGSGDLGLGTSEPVVLHSSTARPDRSPANTDSSHTIPLSSNSDTRSPSPTPPPSACLPKQTCFFWYHGHCSRGDRCDRQHETHITWPIDPPPGYVHRVPCSLPLCPLRQDMVTFKQGNGPTVQEPVDEKYVDEPGEENASDNNSSSHSGEEGAADVIIISDDSSDSDSSSSDTSSAYSLTPTLPSSLQLADVEPPITSISHAGTQTRKRGHSANHTAPGNNKRRHLDPSVGSSVPAFTHKLPLRPDASPLPLAVDHRGPLREPPRGPKAQNQGPLICFYWYHKGYCRPKRRRDGKLGRCDYLHTLDTPVQTVSLPPTVEDHNTHCPLPLCPVRKRIDSYNTAMDRPVVKTEPAIKVESETSPSSNSDRSPRQEIIAARFAQGIKGPKFNQPTNALPNLTGNKLKRFKHHRRQLDQWQVDNLIEKKERERALEKEAKKIKRDERRQAWKRRRSDKRAVTFKQEPEEPQAIGADLTQDVIIPDRVPQMEQQTQKNDEKKYKERVLVDYELPSENRLDWDTDFVRRVFGEIE